MKKTFSKTLLLLSVLLSLSLTASAGDMQNFVAVNHGLTVEQFLRQHVPTGEPITWTNDYDKTKVAVYTVSGQADNLGEAISKTNYLFKNGRLASLLIEYAETSQKTYQEQRKALIKDLGSKPASSKHVRLADDKGRKTIYVGATEWRSPEINYILSYELDAEGVKAPLALRVSYVL